MAELNITNIPAPRVPFIDERTGLMAREWYRFFLNLFVLTGSGSNQTSLDELQIGPPNQPSLTELLIQINQNIAPQYEDQSGDFLATLDTAQLMSMMARFETAEASIQGAYLQPVVQTGTIANYNLDGSPTAGGIAYGTGPALAVSAAGTVGQVLTSAGAGTPTWATAAAGTVTSVTGTAPVVSSGGTTPAISMPAATTSVNGYLTSTDWNTFNGKGSGTVTSVSGTAGRITSTGGATPVIDLVSGIATPGTTGSVSLIPVVTIDTYGRVTSITTAANPQGTVTSVTGTAPVVSSGGATPAISMAAATTSVNGYLTSADWTTFNNKQPAGSYIVNGGALGTPSSGSVTNLTGTASININGTVGVTTANTGFFTTLTTTGQALIGGASIGASANAFYGANGNGINYNRNTNNAAGKYWSSGPDNGNNFVVFNQSVAGVYVTDGGTSWTALSDERFKDIIEPITSATLKVSKLRSVIGKYKTDAVDKRRSFVIAQDVQNVFPEAIDAHNPNQLGVQYSDLIPLLIAAINELSSEIKLLKSNR